MIAAWIAGKNSAKKSSTYSSSASFPGLSKSICGVVRARLLHSVWRLVSGRPIAPPAQLYLWWGGSRREPATSTRSPVRRGVFAQGCRDSATIPSSSGPTPWSFGRAACNVDLDALEALLSSKDELSERRDVLRFFTEHPNLSAFLGSYHPNATAYDRLGVEVELFGQFTADVIAGDKTS